MIQFLILLTVIAVQQGELVSTPSLQGVELPRARQLARIRGVQLTEGVYLISPDNWRADIKPNAVYLQYPRTGSEVAIGDELAVWRFEEADKDAELVNVPDFTGKTWKEVIQSVDESQLKIMNEKKRIEDDALVTDQFPRAGKKAYAGTSIYFVATSSDPHAKQE